MPQYLVRPEAISPDGSQAALTGEEAHHLLRVCRARIGDRVELFDGSGHRWQGRLSLTLPAEAVVDDLEAVSPNETPIELWLLQGLIKGERWEWLIAKATELGVTRIVPVHAGRSVPVIAQPKSRPKQERWSTIALAAAKQCERARVPAVEEPRELIPFLAGLPPCGPAERRLVLTERSLEGAVAADPAPGRVLLAVGPEGGWTPEERDAHIRAGFLPLGLGPRILRAETAAVCGLSLVQARWGDVAGRPNRW